MNINYSLVTEVDKIRDIVSLQKVVWGDGATPDHQLIASIRNGGVIIGAEYEGKMIGFCYGFPGFVNDEVYLVSHMLGIDPEFRDKGIGEQLKQNQYEWALAHGYSRIVWTFDPLESRNAYLNIHKLGGYVRTYYEDYYGELVDRFNASLPSDRFLLEWDVLETHSNKQTLDKDPVLLFDVIERDGLPQPIEKEEEDREADTYFVPIPASFQQLKLANVELATQWRSIYRAKVKSKLEQGYVITGMERREGMSYHYYVMTKQT